MRSYKLLFLLVLSSILCCGNGIPNSLRAVTMPHDDAAAVVSEEEQQLVGSRSETGVVVDEVIHHMNQHQENKQQESLHHRFLEDLEDERANNDERPSSGDFVRPPVDQGLINFGIFMAVVLGLYCIFQIAFCIWGGKSSNPAATLRIAHPGG